MVSIKIDTKQMERDIARMSEQMRKQVPFATALALTNVAWKAREATPAQVRKDIDRPKPFTANKNALFVTKATKANLTAVVGFKDIQARYMQYQIAGGKRRQKGFEKLLMGMGALPAGWVTVPGPEAPIDAYGNIRPAALSEMLSSLKRGMGTYKASGRGRKRATRLQAYFIASPTMRDARTRNLSPGVYKRIGSGRGSRIVPWLFFVKDAIYSPNRFDFRKLVSEVVGKRFNDEFRVAMERAMRTAR